jgi:hypothetical protein
MLISLCTLLSFVALLFPVRHSIQTGAPYDNIGNIAPVYIVLRTSCLSMYVCVCMCVYVCVCVCMYVCMYVCVYVCMCMYVCMYVLCVYVYYV